MKRLAILSSLALIVAPTFSGSGVSDLAKNQIRFAEETGGTTDTSSNPTITFGTNTSNNGTTATIDTLNSIYKNDVATFTSKANCFAKESGDAIRIGASGAAGSLTLSFKKTLNFEKMIVTASQYSSGKTVSISAKLNGASTAQKSVSPTNTAFSPLDLEIQGDDVSTITIETTKYAYISKIEFVVPVESTDATVTYDYGNYKDPSWKTSDTVAKGEKVTPSISTMAKYSDWTGYYILDGWYKDDETTAFDFENTPITENITLHAKWEKEYTKEFANIESSETKSQLYYEYKTIALETTLISFGDNTFSGTTAFKKDSFIGSQSGKDLGVTELSNNSSKCYYQSGSALSVGSTSYAGEFTITFPKIIVKEVNVYAKLFNKNQNYDNFKVSTSANPTGDSKPIEGYTDYAKYSYTGLDNGNDDPSTTITFGSYSKINNKKIAIQKIEIITADTNAAEPTLYTVSNMGLRFGGAIAKDHYEAATQNETGKTVKDHVKSVGMIWATALPETTGGKTYGSLTAAIEAGAITETNAHIKTMDVAEKELVLDGDYYRYNCSISVSEASINTVIYAVATMTFDNGLTIYFEEAKYSVVTIAKKYVEDTTTYNTYSEPIQKTLRALSEGKTSVAIA